MKKARSVPEALMVAVVGCLLAAASVYPAAGLETQYVFMVDTSGSMMGRPPGSGLTVIFPEVQEDIVGYLRDVHLGDSVDIVTFDQGVQTQESFELATEQVRQRAIEHVGALLAEGRNTWVYESVLQTARETIERNRQADAPEVPTVFYVFTDGRDNHPDGGKMAEMLKRFARLTREDDYLYYVTLGVDLPAEDVSAFDEHRRMTLIQNPRGELFRQGMVRIRAKLLDFGVVEDDLSSPRSLAASAVNVDKKAVRIRVTPRFEDVEQSGSVIEVVPEVVGVAEAANLRLRIINRESLADARYEGRLEFSSESENVRIVPDSIPARFSTLEEPLAKLKLAGDATEIDFGSVIAGEKGEGPAAAIGVEFSEMALEDQSSFRVWVAPGESPEAPTLLWGGVEVPPDQAIVAEQRKAELQVIWPAAPAEPGAYRGQIQIAGQGLALQGNALSEAEDGKGSVIAYRLLVKRPPLAGWVIALLGMLILVVLLALAALVAWLVTQRAPWELLRLYLVRLRLAKPRLHGKLVHDLPGTSRPELKLTGSGPVILGPGGDHWQELPCQIQIEAKVRKGKEAVVASRKQGEVTFKPRGELDEKSLSGQELDHQDALVLSDGTEIFFLKF
ncbi:MAG: VWA domain-containing protein [Acidobacteria bacterium]|nr:VWA domain-containing protein [Acidobacteriota bacterium]